MASYFLLGGREGESNIKDNSIKYFNRGDTYLGDPAGDLQQPGRRGRDLGDLYLRGSTLGSVDSDHNTNATL